MYQPTSHQSEMELSKILADLIRLFFVIFTCSPDTPIRSRDECFDQSPIGTSLHQSDEVKSSCYSNERFYPIDGQCYELMTRGPCKENQFFFPDPEDLVSGFCDCQNNFKNASLLLYSAETDECYLQNTQGPCETGEWFVLRNSIPCCELVPEGCEADGKHVYWNPAENDDLENEIGKKCFKLNTQGPCPNSEILQRFISNDVGCQIIGSKNYLKPPDQVEEEVDPRAIGLAAYRTCGPGSKRAQNGQVLEYFQNIVENELNVSAAVAAIRTLMWILENLGDDGTLQELSEDLRKATEEMKKADCSITSVQSGCELFQRFITLATLDQSNFKDCKEIMKKRGEIFLRKLQEARPKIARLGAPFILDGHKILIHSKSRVVLEVLVEASKNKRFHVYVTESSPDKSGTLMRDELLKNNITCTLILDSAVGYVMESVDLVLVGAEGVVESGGIINKIGTYTIALCAKEMNKPVYVMAESFKVVRLYPLNQRDLPKELKYSSSAINSDTDLIDEHPQVDYTPPGYLTLLFTDLGILTPSAVSDELIKLYL